MEAQDVPSAPSRRSMLKRGALVGAAAVWTVPLVQVVDLIPATAATPSAPSGPPLILPTPPGDVQTPHPEPSNSSAESSSDSPITVDRKPDKPADRGTSPASIAGSANAASGSLAMTGPAAAVKPTLVVGLAAATLGTGALIAGRAKQDRTPVTPAPLEQSEPED
jgi:hypothetical protein